MMSFAIFAEIKSAVSTLVGKIDDLPTVTILSEERYGGRVSRRYRLEGGEIAEDWRERAGTAAWCEITVHDCQGRDPYVGSFGGAVWPGAWPDLFVFAKGHPSRLSPRGRVVLLCCSEIAEVTV